MQNPAPEKPCKESLRLMQKHRDRKVNAAKLDISGPATSTFCPRVLEGEGITAPFRYLIAATFTRN